jgi:cell division septation protein DedD
MKHVAPDAAPTAAADPDRFAAPMISHGSFILQVAALKSESDALAMAAAIQNKNFPAFVVMPGSIDKFYRVQVGPYADPQSAKSARTALNHAGFESIFKH